MKDFSKELSFKTSRSSGAGGQNVNKVETSVTVLWKVAASEFFNEDEKINPGKTEKQDQCRWFYFSLFLKAEPS